MDKKKLKKAMKGLTVVGLLAGIGLMASGCKTTGSTEKGVSGTVKSNIKSTSSCGKGSCGK